MEKKVILEFKVNSSRVKELMTFLENNLENARNFEGCLQVKVYYDPDNENMIFDEVWKSVSHHQKYIHFITENGVMKELVSFLASKPDVKYFNLVEL